MKTFILLAILMCLLSTGFSQSIPSDSLYLGQTPPGNVPKVFNLDVSSGSFTAERIDISNDGKEIYYSVVHNYYPITGDTVKCYRYTNNGWTGPFALFANNCAPRLSIAGDTIYYQDINAFYSIRNGNTWSSPHVFLNNLNSAHYIQATNSGKYYISSNTTNGLGGNDWCRLYMTTTDTTLVSLGKPLNTSADNLDFYVAKDESYIIVVKSVGSRTELHVSYHKNDGKWTNPKNLGPAINFGRGMWGPYVTSDNKYLFYSTGINPNYSDVHIYWVRVDTLLNTLKYTNFIPYQYSTIPNQLDTVGRLFSYTIPDSTFIDDDGNNTLTYRAKLTNGNPLPSWLVFDSIAHRFYGLPSTAETLNIKLTVSDNAGASLYTTFKILIKDSVVSVNEYNSECDEIKIYPNPTNSKINIESEAFSMTNTTVEICDILGKVVLKDNFTNNINIDMTTKPKGIYLVKLYMDKKVVIRKISLE